LKIKRSLIYCSLITITILSAGCGGNKLDVTEFQQKVNKKASVPDVCKAEFKSLMPRVAVVNFTNNSTFGKAQINDAKKSSSAFVGVGLINGGFGAGAVSKSNKTNIKRSVDAKLSTSIVPLVENMVVNSGGATLISRNDMNKINNELKLQDSGLLNPDSVVEFGNALGAQFLLTGSINNVSTKYSDHTGASVGLSQTSKNSDNKLVKYGALAASFLVTAKDGMHVKTNFTIKMIDVETGKIVFSETLDADKNIGKVPEASFDQIVGGIKDGIAEALPQLNERFSRYFAVKGYIMQLRSDGDDIIAQINIGSKHKVEQNQLFNVYSFEKNEDPISGKVSCDRIELPIKLRATNQINSNKSWVTVEDGDAKRLKLYQLVQKTHKKAGFELPKKLPF
jgi:PBP1b-binding outer membrane lipoprotein LpoB